MINVGHNLTPAINMLMILNVIKVKKVFRSLNMEYDQFGWMHIATIASA